MSHIIDSHTHIGCFNKNIFSIICAVSFDDFDTLIQLSKDNTNIRIAFGIHPWKINSVKKDWQDVLRHILLQNNNYMIGECGIDKLKPNTEQQQNIFIQQLQLACELHRTIFIHNVKSLDLILPILNMYKNKLPKHIVFHNFNENPNLILKLSNEYNAYFSFGNINTAKTKQCVLNTPINKILVESDGKQNIDLNDTINKIAQIKSNDNMLNIIYDNTMEVLKNG